MEIFIIFLLTLLNGFFALCELSLVSSKRAKLESEKQKGSRSARIALELLEKPEHFLSTMQVGITVIGIISGAYGGVTISEKIRPFFEQFALIAPYAQTIAFTITISIITYLSIVIGELVPKTIALNNPEPIALALAPVVKIFTKVTYPIVAFLSWSTKLILRLFLIKTGKEQSISEDELKLMIKMADQQGVLEHKESEFIQNILRFADRDAYTVMTQKGDVEWVDVKAPRAETDKIILESGYTKFMVCDDEIDNVIGVVKLSDYIQAKDKKGFDLQAICTKPVMVPETLAAIKVLELFRQARNYFAVVVNEFGSVEGIITLHDLTENIFGTLPDDEEDAAPNVVHREDGSLLIDGSTPIDELKDIVPIEAFNLEETDYSTIAGFILDKLSAIPSAGDHFTEEGWRFEVVDMDKSKIDMVLVAKIGEKTASNGSES